MPVLKACLFDLDGTLIDSLKDISVAVNKMLNTFGAPKHRMGEFKELIGDGMRQLVMRALPEALRTEAFINAGVRIYERHYLAAWNVNTKVYAGMAEVVAELRARGVRTGCITNKPHHLAHLCCAHFLPADSFEIVLGQRDAVARKPDPAGAREAAAALGVALAECAYVGDSGIDMDFARNAGMHGIGVTWGFRREAELVAHGAAQIIHRPQDLLALFPPEAGT